MAGLMAQLQAQSQAQTHLFMQQMHQHNMQMQQSMMSFAQTVTAPKPPSKSKPSQLFPKWDGKETSRRNFLTRLANYNADPFWSGADWTQTLPGFEDKSTLLCGELLEHLPDNYTVLFDGRNDLAMFGYLMQVLQPDSTESKLIATVEFGNLEQGATESIEDYLARCRDLALAARVEGVQMSELLPFHVLCCMNHNLFPGLATRIANAYPTLMMADLQGVEETLLRYKRIHKAMIRVPEPESSARRAKQQKTQGPSPAPAPAASPSPSPYPFPIQKWKFLSKYREEHPDFCPGCSDTACRHKSSGCHPWAKAGWVIKHNPADC